MKLLMRVDGSENIHFNLSFFFLIYHPSCRDILLFNRWIILAHKALPFLWSRKISDHRSFPLIMILCCKHFYYTFPMCRKKISFSFSNKLLFVFIRITPVRSAVGYVWNRKATEITGRQHDILSLETIYRCFVYDFTASRIFFVNAAWENRLSRGLTLRILIYIR